MQYIDPYALFDLDVQAPEELDRSRLKRAKQKVLAEFELSEDIVVEIKGWQLDKATALRLLDELEDPVMRRHHFFLHRQPDLQLFLAEDKLRHLRRIPKAEDLGDKDFLKFLSARLAPVFDKHLGTHLRQQHKPEVSLILERLDLIDPWDLDTAMRGSLRYLNQNIQAITVAAEGEALARFDQPDLYSIDLIRLVNRLPRVYQHVRNRYGEALRDLAIALQNRHQKTFLAYSVICAAAELEMDLSAAEHINHTKVELWRIQRNKKKSQRWGGTTAENQQQSSSGGSSSYQPPKPTSASGNSRAVWVLLIILVVTFGVFRGLFRGGNNPFSSSNNYSPIELPDFKALESISKTLKVSKNKRENVASLFDSLEVAPRRNMAGGGADTVQAGEEPFMKVLPVPFGFGKGRPLLVRNTSDKDIVFFIFSHGEERLDRHVYIPANRSVIVAQLRAGLKKAAVYAGTDWQAGMVPWKVGTLPGFASDVEVIRAGKLRFRNESLLFNLEESLHDEYVEGNAVQITFDGEYLQ